MNTILEKDMLLWNTFDSLENIFSVESVEQDRPFLANHEEKIVTYGQLISVYFFKTGNVVRLLNE